jgi:hypothetical protein
MRIHCRQQLIHNNNCMSELIHALHQFFCSHWSQYICVA